MEQYQGRAINDKIAIGRTFLYRKNNNPVLKQHVEETDAEIARLETALNAALTRLNQIYQRALDEVGADDAAIFAVHKILLRDRDYLDFIRSMVCQEQVNAEYAVNAAGAHFSEKFARMEDRYMRSRADDIRDISGQLTAALSGNGIETREPDEAVILLTDHLTPSETVLLDKSKILAFVTRRGSDDSHTAFLIRAMQIPAITGIHFQDDWDGRMAVIDGSAGTITIDPDPGTLEKAADRMRQYRQRLRIL
ncbi:MAG: phosphoenolpyruvate--protein phosphotransferase [Lachnospiraceae bacterium]|nr:phosphoenolpyruvate--protein phosphotransferase [Lachnospiraceae bacterium]